MAKGKAKVNRSGAGPPQPRSLRSRKRESSSDEMSLTLDVGAVQQQDTERNNAAVVITPVQCLQSPVQECAPVTNQLDQTEEQSYLNKPDDSIEETRAEKVVKASEGQEINSTTTINSDAVGPQGFIMNPENDTNKDGKEEINPQDASRSPPQTYTDQVITSEESDQTCATTLKEQLDAKKNSQRHLQRNDKTIQEEPSNVCMAEDGEVTKESTVGLPARKKRRMGMCGLTEKERCHFLQTQKRENGQIGAERIEKQFHNNTADPVAQEQIISPYPVWSSPLSIPEEGVTEQGKAEINLQSKHCGGDNSIISMHRAEPEVCFPVTTSDGTRALCYPACNEGKSNDADGDAAADQEQTDEQPKSNQPTDLKQQEHDRDTVEISAKQRKDGDDVSPGGECSPVITFHTPQNEGTEKKKDGSDAASLKEQSVSRTRDEIMSDTGTEAAAASVDSGTGGFRCDCVELCDAAVTPSRSERKDSANVVTQESDRLCKTPYVPDIEPAASSSTVNTEQTQTRDISEPLGCGYLDNVSDSQLNSIALIEEEMMTGEEDPGFTHCHEDATNLMCGLIGELSSLNRKVMATHKELENLRRVSKTSRSSTR